MGRSHPIEYPVVPSLDLSQQPCGHIKGRGEWEESGERALTYIHCHVKQMVSGKLLYSAEGLQLSAL